MTPTTSILLCRRRVQVGEVEAGGRGEGEDQGERVRAEEPGGTQCWNSTVWLSALGTGSATSLTFLNCPRQEAFRHIQG